MNFVKKIAPKKMISVLDFGAETTLVLFAEKREGIFRLLGGGDSRSRGLEGGELVHVGDAVESIVEALTKAERSSGLKAEKLYFNFDDPQTESVHARGSKNLSGEGQIGKEDIEDAKDAAQRLVSHFEKTAVYSSEIGFLIDDRDPVANPLGVFGRKLEVEMHILLARSEYCERWHKVMQRVPSVRSTPVFSPWSTAYGILAPADRDKKRLIWDLGKDFLSACVFEHGHIREYQIFSFQRSGEGMIDRVAIASQKFIKQQPDLKEILVTGDLAEDQVAAALAGSGISVPVRCVSPSWVEKLSKPAYASAVGLLLTAEELEKKASAAPRGKDLLVHLKDKASTFLSDYF